MSWPIARVKHLRKTASVAATRTAAGWNLHSRLASEAPGHVALNAVASEILEIDTDTDCTQECIDAKDPSEELEVYWTSEFGTLSWSDDDTEQQAAEKPTATAATDRDQDQEICAAIERSMQVQLI